MGGPPQPPPRLSTIRNIIDKRQCTLVSFQLLNKLLRINIPDTDCLVGRAGDDPLALREREGSENAVVVKLVPMSHWNAEG